MSAKREQKLFDLAKRLRNLKQRLNNFYQYQVMMSFKHLLLVGDSNSELGREIIKKFGDTWKIGSISNIKNEFCSYNQELEQFQQTSFRSTLNLEKIDESIPTFSKHIDCILFLPQQPVQQICITNEEIFEECEKERRLNTEPALLASYIASKYLIPNGLLMFIGDNQSFSTPSPLQIPKSLTSEQIGLLNLSIGDREYISVDSYSYQLLLQDLKIEDQNTQITNYIKQWADGQQRPISGSFIKFNSKERFIYPELL